MRLRRATSGDEAIDQKSAGNLGRAALACRVKADEVRQLRADILLAVALSLGPAVGLGLARFGYALLLPAMRAELSWSYTIAGSMNTANAVGYLAGALITTPLTKRVGNQRAFMGSMLITALSLLLTGLATGDSLLLALRALAGLAGAVLFVSGASLAAHLASRGAHPGLIVGLYFGGVGIGILATALGLPTMLDSDTGAWRLAWISMGVTALAASLWAGRATQALPESATRPVGAAEGIIPSQLIVSLTAYFLFGLGYITYMTFIIAFLEGAGGGAATVSLFWAALGVANILSAFIWAKALDRLRSGLALAAVLAVVAVGAVLPLVSTSLLVMLVSGILFGSSFLSVVAAVTTVVRRVLPTYAWSSGIALFTVVFSVGQILGPVVSGALADFGFGLAAGLGLSAGVLALGAVLSPLQKHAEGEQKQTFAQELSATDKV